MESRQRMSAIGTKRTCRVALHMSAFGGKADMTIALRNVRAALLDTVRRTQRSPTSQSSYAQSGILIRIQANISRSEKLGNMRWPVESRTETGETYERNYGWGCHHGGNCHARICAGILCLLGHGQCDRSAVARED